MSVKARITVSMVPPLTSARSSSRLSRPGRFSVICLRIYSLVAGARPADRSWSRGPGTLPLWLDAGRSDLLELALDRRQFLRGALDPRPGEPVLGRHQPVDSCEADHHENRHGGVVEAVPGDRVECREHEQDG